MDYDLLCAGCISLDKEKGYCNKWKMVLEGSGFKEFFKSFPCRNRGVLNGVNKDQV